MLLENGKRKLRQLEPEDLELLYRWENDPTLWAVGNTRQPYSRYTLKQYILQGDEDIFETHQLRLMIECKETRQTVGTVDLFDFDVFHSRVALGLFVDTQYQGKGYASEALRAICDYGFSTLGVQAINAWVLGENRGSSRLLEKQGFVRTQVLEKAYHLNGVDYDDWIYRLERESHPAPADAG